ncbi:uncharacterized protein [Rutidosis leptorrhynchoides]|uniref:uncharacterized protein n=1 Tax=Rutidosis leptorrhynchoides TaxID=125765 RepID=UPI003A9A461B
MGCMGFGSKWCKWIRTCLSTASISILVNRSPTKEFTIKKGVRQGDPLSPFLFILAVEGLNILAKNDIDKGLFKGIEIGNDKVNVSQLQYADDTIFLGECDSGTKISSVKWDVVLQSYNDGGLNIGSLKGKILALLAKWWWRFKIETNSLWVKVIQSIYGSNGGLGSGGDLCYHPTLGTWSNIIDAGNSIADMEIKFKKSFIKQIGNGMETSFWNELWIGNNKLKDAFPRFFRLEAQKDATVSMRIQGDGMFNCAWARHPLGRGLGDLDALKSQLADVRIGEEKDKLVWILDGGKTFTVKSLACICDNYILAP